MTCAGSTRPRLSLPDNLSGMDEKVCAGPELGAAVVPISHGKDPLAVGDHRRSVESWA